MFRQRTSSQKPADNLLADFRSQFPDLASSAGSGSGTTAQQSAPGENPVINAPVQDGDERPNAGGAFQDQDPTPRASNEPWRFTPSLMDPNNYNFSNFANAPGGYYTPTPGGFGTHGLGTPLSMPTSGDAMQPAATVMDVAGFQALPPHQLHHFNPFVQAPPPPPPPQQTFAPASFVHQDTGYETMEHDGSPLDSDPSNERMTSVDSAMGNPTPMINFHHPQFPQVLMSNPLPPSAEKFRYHCTLNAPTAMVKLADEIPITYLNKGQAYSLSIVDTHATLPIVPGTKFRTFVRVSFEDDEQRHKPGICWGLWKEGRGTNEAHQRGGKLQAVEYVEAGQPSEGDDKRTRVELEGSSFDGFSVVWTPGSQGAPEVNIAVRFNFLSTDFSHSKGVKGIPVRLCTKTTALVAAEPVQAATDAHSELCYCKVKLFRDHGAERKLSNDVAHVKKSIDKTKHQIAQAESGLKDYGKRKRSGTKSKVGDQRGPGKVQKHKRTWSISSASSVDGGNANTGRTAAEDDLHIKLQTLQDMFTSTRPVSVLYLRGEDLDDPDKHPVSLPGDMSPPSKPDMTTRDGSAWQARSGISSNADSLASPTPSSISLASQASGVEIGAQGQRVDANSTGDVTGKATEQPTKVRRAGEEGKPTGWIEASGVDSSYRPPLERTPKPVACFYILRRGDGVTNESEPYHRAIYPMSRTLSEFNLRIAAKWGLEPSKIRRTVHVVQNGLEVEMDDDVLHELKEGQDMILQVEEQPQAVKQEWEMAVDDNEASTAGASSGGIILRLTF